MSAAAGESAGDRTPAFLAWTIARPCALKQVTGWEEPERAERLLRAARAYGEGLSQGRMVDGFCLGPESLTTETPITAVTGFRIAETLAIFGGAEAVEQACRGCVVNVAGENNAAVLAGCYGECPLPEDFGPVAELLEGLSHVVGTLRVPSASRESSDGTRSVPTTGDVAVADVLAALPDSLFPNPTAWRHFVAAVRVAVTEKLPLNVCYFPAGVIANRRWRLPPQCSRCFVAREAGSRKCPHCGDTEPPIPACVRHLRGNRPFRPLTVLVGMERAQELITKLRSGETSPMSQQQAEA